MLKRLTSIVVLSILPIHFAFAQDKAIEGKYKAQLGRNGFTIRVEVPEDQKVGSGAGVFECRLIGDGGGSPEFIMNCSFKLNEKPPNVEHKQMK